MTTGETPQMPEYKGAPLSPERGPGLGCFWIQAVALVIAMILAQPTTRGRPGGGGGEPTALSGTARMKK